MSETKFNTDGTVLTIERIMKAPRQKIWDAWTKPELFVKWWGPRGWETTVKHMDFRVGGYLHYCMTCKDPEQKDWFGQESWGKSEYEAIDELKGFTYLDMFCDADAKVTEGMPAIHIAMKFYEVEGGTKVVSIADFGSTEALKQVMDMGMKEGMMQTWDRLEELLAE